MFKLLFVCMGNICRSPSAEGFMRSHLERIGMAGRIAVDSAGTHGYHVGNAPDPRAISAAAAWDVDISQLRARRLEVIDFQRFDRIIAMDRENLQRIRSLDPGNGRAELSLMMDYASQPGPSEVPDPYYGGQEGFAYMCELLDHATGELARQLEAFGSGGR